MIWVMTHTQEKSKHKDNKQSSYQGGHRVSTRFPMIQTLLLWLYLSHVIATQRLSRHNKYTRWKTQQQETQLLPEASTLLLKPYLLRTCLKTCGGILRLNMAITTTSYHNYLCDKRQPKARQSISTMLIPSLTTLIVHTQINQSTL